MTWQLVAFAVVYCSVIAWATWTLGKKGITPDKEDWM